MTQLQKSSKTAGGGVQRMLRCTAMLIVVALLLVGGAWAQSQSINGTIRGRVSDASDAAVADASITVQNAATGFSRTLQSNQDGYYVIPNLPLGTYEILVQKAGFANVKASNVVLEAGKEVVLDPKMQPASVTTTVEVSAQAALIESTQVNVGRTINLKEIENLPLTSRNPYNYILFQPGVSGHPNQELGIPRTLNTNGLLDRINYQMDGMVDTQADRHGLRLFPISDSFVREVQTVSNSYAPEFGQTAGNIYNVITNSGTNSVHGKFQYMRRWVDATARPILSLPTAPKPELKLNDYSGNVGGRIIKDKLFWFAAYEHLDRGVPSPTGISPANAAALGLSPEMIAAAPGMLHAQFFDIRTDWVINSKNTAFLRYNYFRNNFPVNTNSGSFSALDAWSDFADRAHVAGMQLVTTITPNLLNEFRLSSPYRNNRHFAGSQTGAGPVVTIPNVATFNGTTGAGDRFTEKIPNFNENLTWIHGKHSFKFGGAWQENVDLQRSTVYTQYTFPTIAAYLAAKAGTSPFGYSTVKISSGGTVPTYVSKFFSFYGQDSWQITPKLMLIYGVRYDKFTPPDADANASFIYSRKFNSPSANFAPRFGFAYRVTNKTVVRGSGGMFYDSPATNTWFNAFLNNGASSSGSYSPTTPGAPAYPNIPSAVPQPGIPSQIVTVAPNFRNAYTLNGSLQIAQELSSNDSITIGYIHTAGRNLEFLRNMNLINPTGALADGRPVYLTAVNASTRLYPQFNTILLQDTGARSNYDALVANYTHRLSAGVQMSASYTWSHTIGTAPEANSFEQNLAISDPSNMMRDRGNSTVNRPQSLTVSTILEPKLRTENVILRRIVNDNTFAFLANVSSGDQQNITASTATPLNGDASTSSVQRPLGVGRNSVRGPSVYQVDLRYTRTIATLWERVKPQFIIEVNNLFNHPNVTTLSTVAKTNALGQPVNSANSVISLPTTFTKASTVLEGRIVQYGVSVRF